MLLSGPPRGIGMGERSPPTTTRRVRTMMIAHPALAAVCRVSSSWGKSGSFGRTPPGHRADILRTSCV